MLQYDGDHILSAEVGLNLLLLRPAVVKAEL